MRNRRDNQDPINVAGIQFYEVLNISVNEWHPLPNGEGDPTQVHVWFELEEFPHPLVIRFKSRRPVDSFIVALITHANAVWPMPKNLGPLYPQAR